LGIVSGIMFMLFSGLSLTMMDDSELATT
jgi:hypothetical protein